MDFSKVLTVAIFSQLFWKKIHYSTRYIYTYSTFTHCRQHRLLPTTLLMGKVVLVLHRYSTSSHRIFILKLKLNKESPSRERKSML